MENTRIFFSRFGFRSFKKLRNLQDAIVEFPLNQIQNVEAVLNNGSINHVKQLGGTFFDFLIIFLFCLKFLRSTDQ